jgi:transposase
MKLTPEQFEQIAHLLPVQRGNVKISNYVLLNALLYILENGCKWRSLPEHYGKWHTIYTRMFRWAQKGVLDKVFAEMQRKRIVSIRLEIASIDSTYVKVHPDGTGARKKTARNPSESHEEAGPPSFMWLPQMRLRHSRIRSLLARTATAQKDVNS